MRTQRLRRQFSAVLSKSTTSPQTIIIIALASTDSFHYSSMASSLNLVPLSLSLPIPHPSSSTRLPRGSLQLPQFNKVGKALKLSSSQTISAFPSFASKVLPAFAPAPQTLQPFTVFAAKGYKMKTHKVLTLFLIFASN